MRGRQAVVHAAVAVTLAAILAAVNGAPTAGVYSTSESPETASLASQLTHELAEAVADAAGDSKETADSEVGAEAGAAALWQDGAAESSGEEAGRSVGGEEAASTEVSDAGAPVASDLGASGGAASVSDAEHSSEVMSLVNDASDTDTHVMEIAIEPQAGSSLETEKDSGDTKTGRSDSVRKESIHGTGSLRDNGEIGNKQALTHDVRLAPDAAIKFNPVYDDHPVRDDDSRTKKRGEMRDSSAPLEVLVEKEKTMTSLIPLVTNNVMLGNDKMLSIIISEKPQVRSRTNIVSGKEEQVKEDDVRQDTSLTSKKALEKEDMNNEEWLKSGEGPLPHEDSFKSEESSTVDNRSGCDKNTTTSNKVEAHRNETGITTIHVHIKADRCSTANKDDDKTTSTRPTTTTCSSTTPYTTTTVKPYTTTTTTPYTTTTTTPYTKTTTTPYTMTTTKSSTSKTVIASFIITYTPNPTTCRTNASNSNYPHSITYPQISASRHTAAFPRTSSEKNKKASKMRKRRQDDGAVAQIGQPLATQRGTGRFDQEHPVEQDGADEFANSYLEEQPENLLEPYQRSMYDVNVPMEPITALLEMVGATTPLPALLDENLEKSATTHSAVRRSRPKTHVALPVREPADTGTSGRGASGAETSATESSALESSATESLTMESLNVGIKKAGTSDKETSSTGNSNAGTSKAGTSKAGAEGVQPRVEEPYLIDADGDHLVLVPNDATPGASPSPDQKHEFATSPDPLLSKLQRIEQMLHWERQNTLRDEAKGDADGSTTNHDQQRDEEGDHSVKFKGPVLIGEGVHRSESNSNNTKPSNDTKMNTSNFSTFSDQKKTTKEINNSFKFEDYKFENKTKEWGETTTANTKVSGSSSCKSSTSLPSTPACTTNNSEDSKVNLGKLSCGENCTFVQRTIIETVVAPGPDGRLTANSAIIVHNSFLSTPKKSESKSNSAKSKLCCMSKGRMPEMLPVASEDNLKKDHNVKHDDEDPEGTIYLGAPGLLQGRPQVENAGASGIIPKRIRPEGSDGEDEDDVFRRRPLGFATALQGDSLSKTGHGLSQAAVYSADEGGAPRMSSDGAKLSVLEMVNMKPQKVKDSGQTVNIIPGKRGDLQRHEKNSGPSYARVRMVKPDTGMLYGGDNGPHVAVTDGTPVLSRTPKTPEEQEQEGRRFPAPRALSAGRLSPWEAPPHHHKRPHAPPSLLILPDDRLQMAEGAATPSRTLRRPADTAAL